MKKCPFCNADVAENARFCLYCMKPLDKKTVVKQEKKKKKWWLIVLTAVLLLFINLFTLYFIFSDKDKTTPDNQSSDTTEGKVNLTEENSSQNNQPLKEIFNSANNKNDTTLTDSKENKNQENQPGKTTKGEINSTYNTTKSSNKTSSDSGKTPETTEYKKTTNTKQDTTTTTTPLNTTEATTETTTQNNTITNINWYYRSAYSGDYDKRYNKIETKDAIVITGIQEIAYNGIYKIPQTIDGKTVVAIDMSNSQGYTFNSNSVKSSVKKVYLPPALNKIAYGTFSECINLTDLYIAGDYLYADPSVFPPKSQRTGTLTIHSSKNSWCLYGAKYFDVYCSQYAPNEYFARWENWKNNIYN